MTFIRGFWFFVFLLLSGYSIAQVHVEITVKDSISGETIPSVLILKNGYPIGVTDINGKFHLDADSSCMIEVKYTGYFSQRKNATPSQKELIFLIVSKSPEMEMITVSSTRTNSRIDDTPTKIEVLGQEETGEENGIKPGNVASLLGDLSSIQLQNTSAVSGQSNVRIQGLDGRYTQLLRDGLPVYDGFAGGFGVLQLPPLDLKQIELMKGPASTLYGGGAIGGLVNFVSRTPSDSNEISVTANVTSLREENLNLWNSGMASKNLGYTFFIQGTHAVAVDVNGDGFSDVPAVMQEIAHGRFFLNPSANNSFTFGLEGSVDHRSGGDMLVPDTHDDTLHRYYELNSTQRTTGEFLFHHNFSDSSFFDVKASSTFFERDLESEFGKFNGNQYLNYAEATRTWLSSSHDLVIGTNIFFTRFVQSPPTHSTGLIIDQKTFGIFGQYTARLSKAFCVEAGMRGDVYFEENASKQFFLPRLALLWKWNDRSGFRMSGGMGYKTANVLTLVPEEHELASYDFGDATQLKAESSYGGTMDVYWRRVIGKNVSMYLNQSFFFTQVNNPVTSRDSASALLFRNENKPLLTYGSDSYVRLAGDEMELYVGYTWTNALRQYNQNIHIPTTPVHRISFVAFHDLGEHFEAGLEGSWLSAQYRENGSLTHPYFFGAVMISYTHNRWKFVLNAEDVLNVLQSGFEPLYTGPVSSPVFSPIWAPVDGRVVNFSVRWNVR